MNPLIEPGTIWIADYENLPNNFYGLGGAKRKPFIVTCVTSERIGFCYDNGTVTGQTDYMTFKDLQKHNLTWEQHFLRIWPALPSWDDLREDGMEVG